MLRNAISKSQKLLYVEIYHLSWNFNIKICKYISLYIVCMSKHFFLCELFKGSRGHYFNVTMKQWHPITNTTFLSECKIVYYSILRNLPSLSSMKSQSFVSTLMKTFLQEMLLLHVVLRQNNVIVTCLICKFIGGDYLISVVFRC